MNTQLIEGREYILKDDVDGLIQDRISKYAQKTRAAEAQIEELTTQLDAAKTESGSLEALNSQLTELRDQLGHANERYERHTAVASLGINDPDVRDTLEMFYTKANEGKSKSDRVSFNDWLSNLKSDPSQAPSFLREHFSPQEAQPAEIGSSNDQPIEAQTTINQPAVNGAVQEKETVHSNDLIKKGLEDPQFYSQNREAIKAAWFNS